MTRVPRLVLAASTLVAAATLPATAAEAAIDLTGKWQVEYEDASAEFVDVTDVAGAVSLTLAFAPSSPGVPIPFTGTFAEPSLSLTLSGTGCPPPLCDISAAVLPDGNHFDGRFQSGGVTGAVHRVLSHRCECFDGNTTDGDGCDATCRVEPCFTCAGMPSSCSPTPDAGACSDGSPCTTGETCTAGVCSGTRVTPCVDLSGTWDTLTDSGFGILESVARVEQRETVVLFRDDATGVPQHFGTIVPTSGVFTLEQPQLGTAFCVGTNPLSGTAALNGQSYDASGTSGSATPHGCISFPFTQTGTRQCPGSPGCPPPGPALAPMGGVALGTLLLLSTWRILRRQGRSAATDPGSGS